MEKKRSRILAVVLAVCCLISGIPTTAASTSCTVYSGTNVEYQNYSTWSKPVTSYLSACEDGSLMRVQYVGSEKKVLVEYYDEAYSMDESKSFFLPEELPLFGGFYETDSYYFLVTGQKNPDQSPDVEVFRVTKYDKQWNRIGSAGLYDCNTTVPFDAGSLRMDDAGNYLLIRTSHEMYQSTDGYNHQANVTIQLDMETMTITDSYTRTMNTGYGYVSHSFNQFIKVEENKIVSLDHGDAYPRSLALLKYQTDVSTGKFVPSYGNTCQLVPVLTFPGAVGTNKTGAAAGGFEISDTSYLVAGHSVVQDESNLTRSTRNVFVAAVDKTTSAVTTNWLTSYEEGDGTTSTPQLVKISDREFMVLWSRAGSVYYTLVDGQGKQTSQTYSYEGSLSDCAPIIVNGKAVWYTWKNGNLIFYEIPLNAPDQAGSTVIENGHKYENQGVADGYANLVCGKCGDQKQVAVATSINCWWNETDGNGSFHFSFSKTKEVGEKLYYWVTYEPATADSEMEVVSSNPEVASVTPTSTNMGYLTMNQPGSVTLTARPKLNPEVSKSFSLTVGEAVPLEVSSFEVSPEGGQYVNSGVMLKAQAAGGGDSYQYRFSMLDDAQRTTVLQDYGSSNTCQWIPETAGKVTLKVEVQDEDGQTAEKVLEGYQVMKLPAVPLDDIEKTYRYTAGAEREQIDLNGYLPGFIQDVECRVETEDGSGILDQVSIEPEGILSYRVKNTGSVGEEAWIRVTVSSSNYEDLKVRVHIVLGEKEAPRLQDGTAVAIAGGSAFTYGRRLSELSFTGDAVFVDSTGTAVDGTLTWKNPEILPTVNTTFAEWVFTPTDDRNYIPCTGKVSIQVEPAPAPPNMPQAAITVGYEVTQVAQIPLPEGWFWNLQGGAGNLEAGKTVQVTAVYRDTENYQNSSLAISITRRSCENHQYEAAVTKQPTANEPGIRTYTCRICGAQYTEEIPKLSAPEEGKQEKSVKKNRKKTIGGVIYKVTKGGNSKKAEAAVAGISGKKKTAVTIPATVRIDGVACKVTGIGKNAFKGCAKLKKITIKTKTLKSVGKGALKGIHKKAVLKVPKAKYKAYKKLFRAKTGFQKTMKIKK